MDFPIKEIEKLSRLARLAMGSDQLEAMQHDLQKIVTYFDLLNEADVEGVKPMTHAVPVEIPLRKDEVKEGVGRRGLEQSSGYADGFAVVPKIIE